MPMNRVQFQPGLSMREFLSLYGTEELCEAALIARRCPQGFECQRCGVGQERTTFERQGRLLAVRRLPVPVQRAQRNRLRGQQVGPDELVPGHAVADPVQEQRLCLGAQAPPGGELPQRLAAKAQILEGMRLVETDRQLTGRVEIDDAYLGGQRSGGKAGRGSENKVPFVAAVQTTEDGLPHLVCRSPRHFTNKSIEEFLARHTALPLTLVSDGLHCFEAATSAGAVHDREITGGGKASVLNEKFVAVNTLIGNVKTALTETYHAIKFAKYAYRYLAEVQFRFNRRYNLRAILDGLLDALVHAPRRPERGIRVAEFHR